ncbi:adenylyltransferase [Xylariaceae sp. FL0804]|nr:adenylyltransferase [Xylariaceae sp. FL0804]
MDAVAVDKAQKLREQILRTEEELRDLRAQLADLGSSAGQADVDPGHAPATATADDEEEVKENEEEEEEEARNGDSSSAAQQRWPLEEDEYERYARQLILPSVGLRGQLRLRAASVLVVGAGGLGCPAAAYLAGAGVGRLGVCDGDRVELSNLHRQVAHGGARLGEPKAASLARFCRRLNPRVACEPRAEHLTPRNAARLVAAYDVVLDCTDSPASRYLVSDVCVLLRRPLVSASALRTDGQLMVLNSPPGAGPGGRGSPGEGGGPCYRCVFPRPPPAESVVSCGEGGILGPVVGVMGVLQALEAIKLIVAGIGIGIGGGGDDGDGDGEASPSGEATAPPTLLLFSATSSTPFRSIRMRGRRPDCFACSARSTLTLKELETGSLDYVQFCGVNAPVDLLKPEERISVAAYKKSLAENPAQKRLLLDVREREHFEIASIPGAVNVPFSTFQHRGKSAAEGGESRPSWISEELPPDAPIYVVCRVGNDSQVVTQRLKDMGLDRQGDRFVGDIRGGMRAWKLEIDPTMPFT